MSEQVKTTETTKTGDVSQVVERTQGTLIYEKIGRVMADLDPITKDRTSKQNYKYRGIDDVLKALNPILVRHKIFILPDVISQQRVATKTNAGSEQFFTILTVRFSIVAEDGSTVQCTMVGEAQDTGDKSSSKASSVAFRNMAFQVFCIPTDDPELDPEFPPCTCRDQVAPKDGPKQNSKVGKPAGPKPGPVAAKEGKPAAAKKANVTPKHLTQDQLKRLYTILGAAKWPKESAKEYMRLCFNIESSTELTKTQYDQVIAVAQNSTLEVAIQEARIYAQSLSTGVGDYDPNFAEGT